MFKKDSILYDVNAISKLISLLIFIFSLMILKSPAFLLLMGIAFLFITYSYPIVSKISFAGILLSIISSFFQPALKLAKIVILVIYTIIMKRIMNTQEFRYILEVTLYKFQSKKITFYVLYIIYFFKYLKNNLTLMNNLREDYAMAKDWDYRKFAFKKAYQKTKYEIKELMMVHEIRFYNYSSSRTYIEKKEWESWDTKYLVFHILLFIFILIYGSWL
ncbi:MAG: hypothetical protein E7168_03115 [Firmicutes bacterium]|nr:hypothetical protein [Bacillota bacterium]